MARCGASIISELTQRSGSLTRLASDLGQAHQQNICTRYLSRRLMSRAYLYNIDPTKDPYSGSQVHQAEQLLGLKRKATSTTANLAFLPVNLQKCELYWTLPPPLGMRGVSLEDIVDVDELVSCLSIRIKGTTRLFCVYAAVRIVCMEKGRRLISFLQSAVMMLAECIGIHSGWMEEQQLRDF